jgi:pyruvate formate lyase activating enzyme
MKKEAFLYEKLKDKKVHCFLCAHQCNISDSKFGICGVRQNIDGILYTHVYGDIITSNIDPIEKKPLYHFHPGTSSYSIATAGCNFRCGFCQNWQISQLRRKDSSPSNLPVITPDEVVQNALLNECHSISYTYTEPTIFFEYAYDVAKLAQKKGLSNVFVTNGYMSKEAVELIHPYLDAANVDLKSFRDDFYK